MKIEYKMTMIALSILISVILTACGGGGGGSAQPATAPQAPTAFTATAPTNTQFNLSWTDNSANETGFVIEKSVNTGSTYSTYTTVGANVTNLTITSGNWMVSNYFRVYALNSAGTSSYSNAAPVTQQFFDQKIGIASGQFPRNSSTERREEVAIGNLTADALRLQYGTQLVLINSGMLRAPIPSSYIPTVGGLNRGSAPYDVVKGDVFIVLPFGNSVVTRTITGQLLWSMLENGVSSMPTANGRFPQISGFTFVYSVSNPTGSRVTSVLLAGGAPILNDTSTTYSIAVPDFINKGGDGYTMLNDGQGQMRGAVSDVLIDYIISSGTISPAIEGRINQIP